MEWDKIWAYNKDAIDFTAPRYTAIVQETSAKLILDNGPAKINAETHPLHQKKAKTIKGDRTYRFEKVSVEELPEKFEVLL